MKNTLKNERGYTALSQYSEKYYKFPSFLITNPNYSKLKDSSKLAYMLFKNEFRKALVEKWIDSDGILYLEFTQAELMSKLNCYQGKVTSILNQLESCDLIQIEHGKFDPVSKKNTKNRYYILQPELNADDYIIPDSNHNLRNAKITHRIDPLQIIDNSDNAKIAHREIDIPNVDNTGNVKIAQDYYNKQDTLKEDTKEVDTEKDQQLDQELLATFHLTNTQTFLTENSLKFIALFSKTFNQAYETVGLINRAKKKVEKETGVVLIGEDWQEELDLHLRRVVQKIRTDRTIKQADNYMFKSFCYFFEECSHQSQTTKNATPDISVTLHNWLD